MEGSLHSSNLNSNENYTPTSSSEFKLVPSTDFSYLDYLPNVNDSIDLITLDSQDTKPVTLFKIKKKKLM